MFDVAGDPTDKVTANELQCVASEMIFGRGDLRQRRSSAWWLFYCCNLSNKEFLRGALVNER